MVCGLKIEEGNTLVDMYICVYMCMYVLYMYMYTIYTVLDRVTNGKVGLFQPALDSVEGKLDGRRSRSKGRTKLTSPFCTWTLWVDFVQ